MKWTADIKQKKKQLKKKFCFLKRELLCSQSEPGQRLPGTAGVHHTGPRCSRLILWVHILFISVQASQNKLLFQLTLFVYFSLHHCSIFLSVDSLPQPADDQRSNQPLPGLQHNIMVSSLEPDYFMFLSHYDTWIWFLFPLQASGVGAPDSPPMGDS